MDDQDYIPVRPNVNNRTKRAAVIQKEPAIDFFNQDQDVQHVLNKRQSDALTMESKKTKEEQRIQAMNQQNAKNKSSSKDAKENDNTNSDQQAKGMSWVVIIFAIIVILLILVIIYFIMNYNNIFNKAPPIPENIVKPTDYRGMAIPPIAQAIKDSKNNSYIQAMPPKPKNYVEPTENELDDALNMLSHQNQENKTSQQKYQKQTNRQTQKPLKSSLKGKERHSPENITIQMQTIQEVSEISISDELKNSIMEYDEDMDSEVHEHFVEQAAGSKRSSDNEVVFENNDEDFNNEYGTFIEEIDDDGLENE